MNMGVLDAEAFARQFIYDFQPVEVPDAGIAPPFTTLPGLSKVLNSEAVRVLLGAQNVHWLSSGAHTGEVSAPMLAEHKVDFAIVGHSERREFYGECDENVALRARAAIEAGMTAVVCVGETKEDYEARRTDSVVDAMLDGSLSGITAEELPGLVIAYEPVWAIGTGLAATPEIASRVHNRIRERLERQFGPEGARVRILYGGSTKPDNIAELMAMANINGALVGGASLDPNTFNQLILHGRQGNAAAA